MNLISLARYSSGMGSAVSTCPPACTYARNSASVTTPPYRTVVRLRLYHVHSPPGADAPGRAPVRRARLPRHLDRRPREGDGGQEELALRAHREQAGSAL